jgi:hypothetical protein
MKSNRSPDWMAFIKAGIHADGAWINGSIDTTGALDTRLHRSSHNQAPSPSPYPVNFIKRDVWRTRTSAMIGIIDPF